MSAQPPATLTGPEIQAAGPPKTSSANATQHIQRRAYHALRALAEADGISFADIPIDLAAEVRGLLSDMGERLANRGGNRRGKKTPAD